MAAYNNQMMAQALRRPDIPYPTGGGTVGRPMAQSLGMGPGIQPVQEAKQPSLAQMKENGQMMDAGIDKFKNWFGAGGGTGADIGAGAQQFGPEVAKMNGEVVGDGGTSAAGGGGWVNGLLGGAGAAAALGGAGGGGSDWMKMLGGGLLAGIDPSKWSSKSKNQAALGLGLLGRLF